jgi:hypothetical protein
MTLELSTLKYGDFGQIFTKTICCEVAKFHCQKNHWNWTVFKIFVPQEFD